LYDVRRDRWGIEGIVLAGYEINVVDKMAIEHRQAWPVNPIFDQQ
jgi:hypothetical protein